ncbi:type I-B CRISPR-associated protein Cas7/Cst2/DevR [Pelotomaculum terephthalicicum JT]|uniref:type I-B CRISPR-associated protein Cas7/Cst2/DevR n=1 Tax=Pelotomaculum terephthalicicum TaxID=206393 RepID=UPI001F039AC6|nr:type I-B CRISPR-associated protein Cas7/Cst2/DevR [Pelotomaculum terephthalicicum]MCG9968976.1 type I-B CRISPR-associated protein Cas7/Cst2/DevR [Pelotomaculum terephthalicicum JT]
MKNAKALTITYLVQTSLGSLNGSDKEADNISSIKKFTRGTEQYPYGSAQWVRRALRDQLANLGWELSEGVAATIKKGAATTQQMPEKYIDDDLFGFMGTEKGDEGKKGSAVKRTSPVRVSPLVSMERYKGDLDFGTNYMSVSAGGTPNIFETEIHSGFYRGTVLIEIDRVGCGEGFNKALPADEKAKRVKALISALKNLWSSGRQTRFLADISPKFIASALLKVKNPVFLESLVPINEGINIDLLTEVIKDYKEEILAVTFGGRKELFKYLPENTVSIGEAFAAMDNWVSSCYL